MREADCIDTKKAMEYARQFDTKYYAEQVMKAVKEALEKNEVS